MKAIVITRPGDASVLAFEEVEDPSPGRGEILIEVRAAALNRADVLQRRGLYPPPEGTRERIPGLEVAGTVKQRGPSAGRFQVGDRVMALLPGEGYAELVSVDESLVMAAPDELGFEEAAAIPEVYLTAYDAIFEQLELGVGDTILIHAVGSGVGTAALQLSVEAGLVTIGTAGSREKLERAAGMGLRFGIHYKEEDFVERVAALTEDRGVDAVLDLVGAAHWKGNLDVIRSRGRLMVVGLVSGGQVSLDLRTLLSKRLTVIGTALRSRSVAEKALLIERFSRRILPPFEAGRLRPVVDRIFDWGDAAAAHRWMEENRNFGKIVLSVS